MQQDGTKVPGNVKTVFCSFSHFPIAIVAQISRNLGGGEVKEEGRVWGKLYSYLGDEGGGVRAIRNLKFILQVVNDISTSFKYIKH